MAKIYSRTALAFLVVSVCLVVGVSAQTSGSKNENPQLQTLKSNSVENDLDQIRRLLLEQQAELEKLRGIMSKQAEQIERLQQNTREMNAVNPKPATLPSPVSNNVVMEDMTESRLRDLEERTRKTSASLERNQLGSLGFSGDLRMQYDSIYGQLNSAANVTTPSILGNELSSRQRVRFRLRFAVTGKIGKDVFTGAYTGNGEKRTDKEFEWGFRLSTGSLSNPASPNPVLTDFYSRKPIALDRAFVAWRPQQVPGFRLIAGKFEPIWNRTEMTIDNDVQVEGIGQTYSRDFRHKIFKQFTVSTWQLPMLERNSAFVRNPDGTVNIDESRRSGRDLGMYGGQVSSRIAFSPESSLTFSASDLYFANTGSINPVQVFGNQLQLPVTIVIPATATEPSRTVTGVATIPREFLQSGNGNLGLSSGTNAAVNRDGKLSSGFNLVDLMAQFEYKRFRHMPLTMIVDFVRNTATRNVISANAAGNDVILQNNHNDGIWAEFRLQSLRKQRESDLNTPVKGDILLSYTFLRIEKDAVFTPLNWDDLVQQSDIQGHRIFFSYFLDPRVTFNITGLFNQRLNGLLGPFRPTPEGSLSRSTMRLQFDTVFRF